MHDKVNICWQEEAYRKQWVHSSLESAMWVHRSTDCLSRQVVCLFPSPLCSEGLRAKLTANLAEEARQDRQWWRESVN